MDIHLLAPLVDLSVHALKAFENAGITALDLVSLSAKDVSQKTRLPVQLIQHITAEVIKSATLVEDSTAAQIHQRQCFLTTGDIHFDETLGGGFPVGHITEIVGESGVGKSQLACQLCVTAQLPVSLGGLGKQAVYLSTESGLATSRAVDMANAMRQDHGASPQLPSNVLNGIHFAEAPELDAQDHMLYYHLPRLLEIQKGKIGLLVIDSIATNYRAEFQGRGPAKHAEGKGTEEQRRARGMGQRSKDLQRLISHLRLLAFEYNLVIVVVNQVADRISDREDCSDVLNLDHQSQWFHGWHHDDFSPKTPALGLIWTNAVHVRIALKRTADQSREFVLVYSPFKESATLSFSITAAGLHHDTN